MYVSSQLDSGLTFQGGILKQMMSGNISVQEAPNVSDAKFDHLVKVVYCWVFPL